MFVLFKSAASDENTHLYAIKHFTTKKMSNCISGILFGVLRLQEEISQLQGKLDNSSALSEAHLGAHTRAENQVPTSGLEVLRVIHLNGEILQKSQPRKTSYKW